MRKYVFTLILAALFLFSGCNMFHFGGGNSKPSPSASEEVTPKPTPKPTPSPEPSPSEEESPSPSHASSGHIFGSGGNFSNSGGTHTEKPDADVQEAQIRTYAGESLDSTDDVVYTDTASVRADYDGDGTKDVLDIDFSRDYPQSDEMNSPVKITLSINGSSAVFEDTWNDGVSVGIADFDASDKELDIYIIALGTDLSAHVTTFWYDGKTVLEFTSFEITEDTAFRYDTKGYLYYKGEYNGEYGVMIGLKFYTGEVFTVD